jgi:hypothetical protein
MIEKTGSCFCGGVQYIVSGKLRNIVACHCIQCRKTSGHYVAATQCATSDISITAETLSWYRSSESAERGFCNRCGGNVFWRKLGTELISILAGTLDGKTDLRLEQQIHVESKGDYYDLPNCAIIEQSVLP